MSNGWAQALAITGCVATLELLVARITGGGLPPDVLLSAALFAVALGLALGLGAPRRLEGRRGLGDFATAVPPVLYGWWAFAAPEVGSPGWPAMLGLGAMLLGAAYFGRLALSVRGASALYAGAIAASLGYVAWREALVPELEVLGLGLAAVTGVLALGRFAPILAVLALLPAAPERWEASAPAPALPDVLLISVDTLRLDAAQEMASLRGLAAEGRRFEAQAASPWTLPSLASLLTGLEPSRHQAGRIGGGFGPVSARARTLAEHLAGLGYDTAATVQSPFARGMGLERGFARYRSEEIAFFVAPSTPYSDRAQPLGAAVLRALGAPVAHRTHAAARVSDLRDFVVARRERPLFTWVHLFDPHLPYRHARDLDLPYLDRLRLAGAERLPNLPIPAPDFLPLLRRGYDHEVAVTDRAIAEILANFPAGPHGRIVVVTSDHGEEFGEHAGFEHGHTFHQELLSVPLVIAGIPALSSGDAGHVDVVPTVLHALGRQADAIALDGRDLAGAPPDRPPLYRSSNPLYGDIDRRAVRRGAEKLIARGSGRLYFDLEADPGEQDPRPLDDGDRALASELPPARLTAPGARPIDASTEAALRALGYVEGEGEAGPAAH